MFTRFDASKSTKGASKLRRDLINAEIANLRDLLPLPPSTRQRLSQLQLMALVCVYVRKANYFQQAFKRHELSMHQAPTPNIGFSKALSGFLMMMTQNGKLLYISDNAAEYLGHSMEDLLIHGDSVYDIIDKQDHQAIQSELGRELAPGRPMGILRGGQEAQPHALSGSGANDCRIFLCRMNVSRNARRQMRFGDQKVVLVRGHFLSFLPLCSRNEPVFLATCMPIAMPETRECIVQGATNVFTSIHSMDMKFMHIDKNGEFHMDYTRCELQGLSWYRFLHWESTREAQIKHRLITQSEQDRSCILLVRLQRRNGDWLWVHCVLQVKENMENTQEPVIVCTNQVLSEHEALVMRTNTWLYHYYLVQSKLQYGLTAYETHGSERMLTFHQQGHSHNYSHNSSSFQGHSGNVGMHDNQHLHQGTYVQNPVESYPQHQHQHNQQAHMHQHKLVDSPRPDTEPVDYSVNANTNSGDAHVQSGLAPRVSSPSSAAVSVPLSIPLYSKRRSRRAPTLAPLNLEPLKIDEPALSVTPTPASAEVLVDLERTCIPAPNSGAGMLLLPSAATAVPLSSITLHYALSRPRLAMKSGNGVDPIDILEQWNPSPPWSDTLQKVPDIAHQDLSPYTTTTPPTPTGTPGVPHSTHMTFTFDWAPEQYVPNLNTLNTRTPADAAIDTNEEHYGHYHHHCRHYSHYSYHQQPSTDTVWSPVRPRASNITTQLSPSEHSKESV